MNKSIIEQFAEEKKKNTAEKAYSDFLSLLFSATDDVANKLRYITPDNTKISAIGEYAAGCFIDETGGEIEIFFGINDPQVILATKDLEQRNMELSKQKTITFRRKKKKRKKKQQEQQVAKQAQISYKNTCQEITEELFKALINYFDEKTKLMVTDDGIKVLCIEDLGYNFLIRIGTFSLENDKQDLVTELWNPVVKKNINVDFLNYFDCLEAKNTLSKGKFYRLIRIFKNFRKNMLINKYYSSRYITRYMIELLAYNVPNELLIGNDYDIFVKAINYLAMLPVTKYKSFDNKPIGTFKLANVNYQSINTFINLSKKMAYKM